MKTLRGGYGDGFDIRRNLPTDDLHNLAGFALDLCPHRDILDGLYCGRYLETCNKGAWELVLSTGLSQQGT